MSKSKLDFKIAVAQIGAESGNVRRKVSKMLAYIDRARLMGAKIVVFPEAATSDYMLGDRWENDAFLKELENADEVICKASTGIIVVWGSIKPDWGKIGEDGRTRKYNVANIAQNGDWVSNGIQYTHGWVPKTNLPKYRIFDDARHFYPAAKLASELEIPFWSFLRSFSVIIDGAKIKLGLTVCEDIWEDEYELKPAEIYGKDGADIVICISHSPKTRGKSGARDKMLVKRVKDTKCPILYVNAVGLQNNAKNLVWFDGGSCLMGVDGKMKWMAPIDREDLSVFFIDAVVQKPNIFKYPEGVKESHDALIAAMRDFYKDYKRVIIGLSGGIDSAVSLALHVKALGADRVLAINMPTQFNSKKTQDLAALCAKNFGVEYRVVPIQAQFEARLQLMMLSGYPNPSDFDRQNMQARIRGQVLADISALEATRLGGRVGFTCNGNKTEVALNYFTLYGDGAGCSAFFADFWKGEMYELAGYVNKLAGRDIVPQGIIDIVPSAELSASQNVDEGKGDPIFYPYHDKLLQAFTDKRWDPTNIMQNIARLDAVLGCEPGTVAGYFKTHRAFVDDLDKCWRQYSYEGKRHMLPPGFIWGRHAFGFDRRDTIADGYFTDEYLDRRETHLKQAA